MGGFTHLHVASCLSSHYGTAWPEELVQAQSGGDAAALTDQDGLYGAVRHVRACTGLGLAPIVGADLSVDDAGQITVLAHGHDHGMGWASLCRLISAAWKPRPGRRVPSGSANREAMTDTTSLRGMLHGEGGPTGTVLLGPLSDVGQAALNDDQSAASARLRAWTKLLPGGVCVEVVCHYTRPGTPACLPHAAAMLRLAHEAGVPAVLTNAVRYLDPSDAVAGDVLDSAARLLPLGEFPVQPNAQAWLKPPEMMARIAAEVADAAGLRGGARTLLEATEQVGQTCFLDPAGDIGWQQPKLPSLESLGLSGDPQTVLTDMCRAGLPRRYPDPPHAKRRLLIDRLDDELGVIAHFGFATYFLTVSDIVARIAAMGVRAQARGSGVSSLVNYVLGISIIDPIEHDLLFERFLGVRRETLPDIDVDVESARRHEICQMVARTYGTYAVSAMASQNQYRARGAIRDAGTALGMDEAQIDHIAKAMWRLDAAKIPDALQTRPELAEVAELARSDPMIPRLLEAAGLIDRLPRHVSLHPCGMIVSDENLLSVTPTQPSGLGVDMSQFDKDDVDDLGLLKLDILGVRMQSAIAHTLDQIWTRTGTRLDMGRIPHDDEPTFDLIRSTNTIGIFQIESPGQRELVGKMQPGCMADLVADISLFRPGPVKADMITPYLEAKLGFRYPVLAHPVLRPILAETHGVVIYHEQVLRILHAVMGVSLAEADALRRRLGSEADAIEVEFRRLGAARKDDRGKPVFTPRQIDAIWNVLKSFGSFGFCKAHAAAFATTTYESAYLKAHYPAEFFSGLLEHDPGMYPRRLIFAEARRMGIPLLGVDVNRSGEHYQAETLRIRNANGPGPRDGAPSTPLTGIRIPFTQISGISGAQIRRLVDAQPYTSIADVILRARPNRPILAKLAAIGAFDSLAPDRTRGDIIAHVRHLSAVAAKRQPGPDQDPLPFDPVDPVPILSPPAVILTKPGPPAPDQEPESVQQEDQVSSFSDELSQLIDSELDILHADVSAHLLDPWRPFLDDLGVTYANDLLSCRANSTVLVAGVRVASGTPPTRTGKRVAFISLDDGTGISDIAFFDDAQHSAGPHLFTSHLMLVQGRTRRTGPRGISITATTAWDLTTLKKMKPQRQ